MKKKECSILVADYRNGIIWLDGGIIPKTAEKFLKILQNFKKIDSKEIVFYIKGIGGDPFSTFLMMRSIKDSGLNIGCVAYDYVNSGCFTLTQAGSWVAALPNTTFCFHPSILTGDKVSLELTQGDLKSYAERLNFIDLIQLQWFFSRGRQLEKIYELFKIEAKITVPQAIKIGLVDYHYKRNEFLEDRKKIMKILGKKNRKTKKRH